MHDDAMTHAKWESDNGQMQERYVHYDAEEMFMRCMI